MAPSAKETPPIEMLEFASFPFEIDPRSLSSLMLPANCAFEIVPTRDPVGYPVASCKLNAGVASVHPKETVTPPKLTEEDASLETEIAALLEI